ncbi:MAG: phosphatidate cytidylyltransferase [Acidimicrobiales bacterium]
MDDSDEFEPGGDAMSSEPITERVRIYGAEPAGTMAGSESLTDPGVGVSDGTFDGVPEQGYLGLGTSDAETTTSWNDSEPLLGADDSGSYLQDQEAPGYSAGEPSGSGPMLPHWTDPPTGQVPAIVDRRGNDADWDPLTPPGGGPSWKEHDQDWDQANFDPSLLADDDTRVGALEERPLAERQPWEFDDLGTAPASGRTQEGAGAGDSWWDEDADSADVWNDSGTDENEDDLAHAFASDSEVAEPVTTTMSRSSLDERGQGRFDEESTYVASISSSPLRGAPSRHAAGGRRGHARRSSRSAERGGGAGRGAGRNIPVAIATGVGIFAVTLLCLAAGTVATLVLSTVVVTLAVAECYAALRRTGKRPATLLGLVATVGLMVSVYAKGVSALPLVLVLLVMTSMLWYLAGAEQGSAVEGITTTVLAFAWIAVLGSFAALMLAPSQYPHRHGLAFMLGAVVAVVAADVGALVVGRWIGRHPLAAHVSPNKTWEGLIGGTVVAVVASIVITGHVHPWTPCKAAVLGIVASVIGPIGDLCESLVKRDLGLKDMGALLPGHGGVLDRVDALLFVLPATYYLVRVLHLG